MVDLPSAGVTLGVFYAPGVADGAALRIDFWKLIPYQGLEGPVFFYGNVYGLCFYLR